MHTCLHTTHPKDTLRTLVHVNMQLAVPREERRNCKLRDWLLRSEVNIELNFPPKLRGARSRLNRRRFLQPKLPNAHFPEFFEIYKICNPLHRSDLKISA